jgi:branched-chain amino acid transport system permease protein
VPDSVGLRIGSQTVDQLSQIVIGALIIVFLIVEPHGLAHIWNIAKQKLRVWPFPY